MNDLSHVSFTPLPRQARALAEMAIANESPCAPMARALLAAYDRIEQLTTEISDLRSEDTQPCRR